jgi:hypothetical protein
MIKYTDGCKIDISDTTDFMIWRLEQAGYLDSFPEDSNFQENIFLCMVMSAYTNKFRIKTRNNSLINLFIAL